MKNVKQLLFHHPLPSNYYLREKEYTNKINSDRGAGKKEILE